MTDDLGALLADRLEPVELALGLPANLLGHLGLLDLRAVLVDDRALVLAELLADRLHLLAQDVLALLLLHARLDVVADAAAHLELGQPLALERDGELEPLAQVDGLEDRDLLLEAEVRRVADRVGEGAGLGDRADERRDAAVVAAHLEDLLDDRAVLALELLDAAVHGLLLVGPLVDLDAQLARTRRCAPRRRSPRWRPDSDTARAPPGRRTRSTTSATVPTLAKSPSWRGTSSTRSSSPTSSGSVTSMLGKTTMSSSGTSRRVLTDSSPRSHLRH